MIKSFSKQLGVSYKFVGRTLYGSGRRDAYYTVKEILKRNGKIRTLHAVHGRLKILQQKTYEWLEKCYLPSDFAKGFVKGRGIITNAMVHRNKKNTLSLDELKELLN